MLRASLSEAFLIWSDSFVSRSCAVAVPTLRITLFHNLASDGEKHGVTSIERITNLA